MSMVEAIKKIRETAGVMCAYYDKDEKAHLEAIAAALEEAEKDATAFQRAREAWKYLEPDVGMGCPRFDPRQVLDEFFGGGETRTEGDTK